VKQVIVPQSPNAESTRWLELKVRTWMKPKQGQKEKSTLAISAESFSSAI